jgi:hypothetical protein
MNNNVIRVYRTDPVNTNGMNGIVGNTMPLQQEEPFRNLTDCGPQMRTSPLQQIRPSRGLTVRRVRLRGHTGERTVDGPGSRAP